MSVLIGIFIEHRKTEVWVYERTEILVYDQTTDEVEFEPRVEIGAKLDQIISDFKLEFKEKLIKIYVVDDAISNIDSNSVVDSLVHPLMIDDVDFTHYLPVKLTPETKIVLIDHKSTLYEYVKFKNEISEYKPVKCFEARLDMENHLQLMLHFFECELNQVYFIILRLHALDWDSGSYLKKIKKENKDFSSYIVFTYLPNSEKAIIYGRYLTNDNIQSLLRLQRCLFLSKIELNSFNFKVNKVIPSYRAIETYESQTRLMGIDLGASRIVVCVSRNGRTELLKIDREYSMPSIISFAEDEPVIGNVAKRHLAKKPELVLFDLKHLRDTKRNLDEYSWHFGHCIEQNKSSFVFQSKESFKQYSTTEIYQTLLQELKENASEYQSDLNDGKDVDQAIITVPNFDNELMLEDIVGAAESVGLKILDIITETHADLLYLLSYDKFSIGETVAVVDIGGGTGFIEKFSFEKGFHEKCDLSFFCGKEIDETFERALRNLFYERFKIWTAFSLKQKMEFEKIKEDFSFEEELQLSSVLIQKEVVLPRSWFENQVLDQIFDSKKNQEIIKILKNKKYSSNISKVFLVGGTCRIPYIQKLFKTIFGEEKVIIPSNLQEITATGALIHGLQVLNGEIEPVFQRIDVEKRLNSNESVNKHMENKVEIDPPMNGLKVLHGEYQLVFQRNGIDKRLEDNNSPKKTEEKAKTWKEIFGQNFWGFFSSE